MDIFSIVTGAAGALGLGAIIMHFLKKDRHKAEVDELVRQTLTELVNDLRQQMAQERIDCDEKIAKLREEMNEMSVTIAKHSKTLNDARNSCNSGCFADQNAA